MFAHRWPLHRSSPFVLLRLGWMAFLLNHVLPAASIECGKESTNVENRLKSALLCQGYQADVRPRKEHSQTVNLSVSYHVLTYDFDVSNDLLLVDVWMDLQWTDDFLHWDSSKWGGIERLALSTEQIWFPDFRHFSSFYNPEELPDCANPKCTVAENGTVTCLPVCSMNAKCEADYSRWPYDVHRCNMWYGTWANSMDEVDIHLLDVCLARNREFGSPKWSIVSLDKSRSVVRSSDNYMYTILSVEVMLVRKPGFEYVAIVGPILILALLNVYIVWLRSSSFERKVMLGLSIFTHFSYLKQLEWTLPYNGDTLPNCMIFLLCSAVIGVALLILTLLNCWLRMRLNRNSITGSFIDRLTGSFSQSRVAELILAADYLELNYKVTQDEKVNYWERLAKLLDRAVAIVCVVIYVTLFCILIPYGHEIGDANGVNCYISA
uniref:Neurotransmitter-gated ion-channel ligand-binding domain-containing protein n=1 Tax=Anopheles farauti TaxID=69004 RepID=A0A182QQ93_9DIPT